MAECDYCDPKKVFKYTRVLVVTLALLHRQIYSMVKIFSVPITGLSHCYVADISESSQTTHTVCSTAKTTYTAQQKQQQQQQQCGQQQQH